MRASRTALALLVTLLGGALLASERGSPTPLRPAAAIGLPHIGLHRLLRIATVDPPPRGTGLQLHIDFPAGAPETIDGVAVTALTAKVTPKRKVHMQSSAGTAATTGDSGIAECTDASFMSTGISWPNENDFPVRWRFRRRSVPDGLNHYSTQHSIRQAHHVWPDAESNCTNTDSISMAYDFRGKTKRRVGYDGHNVVEFGSLGAGALAVNYAWYRNGKMLEVDLRFNRQDYRWTNKKKGKHAYHVSNVATHELGHQLGLDDLGDPHGRLTMFGRIGKGESNKLTLGRGDVRGGATLSP